MTFNFADNNLDVIDALKQFFSKTPGINIYYDDIFNIAKNAIVSPSNCYGFMDGGIDKVYMNYFGDSIQKSVLHELTKYNGYLDVGKAVTINTGNDKIPYLIIAPTMEMPEFVDPINCFKTMRAILREIDKHDLNEIYCPGLCTGVGEVDYLKAAEEIFKAYDKWLIEKN